MSVYTLGPLPKETPPAIVREFLAISEGIEQPRQVVAFAPTAVEPQKPRDGMMVLAVTPWDPGYGFGPYIYSNGWVPMFGASVSDGIEVACAGETTDMATGLVRTFWLPYPVEIDEAGAGLVDPATGSSFIVDVKADSTSIFSTKITIEAGEATSVTATTQPVVSAGRLAKGTQMTIHVDQIGSTDAGQGLKVWLVWRKVS